MIKQPLNISSVANIQKCPGMDSTKSVPEQKKKVENCKFTTFVLVDDTKNYGRSQTINPATAKKTTYMRMTFHQLTPSLRFRKSSLIPFQNHPFPYLFL